MDRDEKFMLEHGVEMLGGCKYQIVGRPYTITMRSPEFFTPEVRTWECDCPAGARGRDCKHVAQVQSALNKLCDEFGYE